MKLASWIAVLVGFCVLVWTPLAYGVPSDPGWISGFWDEATTTTSWNWPPRWRQPPASTPVPAGHPRPSSDVSDTATQ
jgi:hypothetical protein